MRGERLQSGLAATWPLASLLLGACGGHSTTRDRDASVVATDAGVDGSSDLDAECSFTCPVQEPEAGAPCSTSTCAYAVDASSGCARAYLCLGHQWLGAEIECSEPQGAGCPATAADIEAGQACDPSAPPCGYPGTVCQCVPFAVADASYTWFCFDIAADCPPAPPLAGTPCAPRLDECAYGANMCAARGFGFFDCQCGLWNEIGLPPCK
jgi:hypothetical protein